MSDKYRKAFGSRATGKAGEIKKAEKKPQSVTVALSKEGRAMAEALGSATVEYLKAAFESFSNARPPNLRKDDLARLLASLFEFSDRTAFERFFAALPAHVKKAIERGTYYPFVEADRLGREFGVSIVVEEKESYGYRTFSITKDSRMRMFQLVDNATIQLPNPFRHAFARWLSKPDGWDPEPIVLPERFKLRAEDRIEEVLPLVMREVGRTDSWEAILDRPSRNRIRQIEEQCGIRPFPVAERFGVFAGDLLMRFLAVFGSADERDGERTSKPDPLVAADPLGYIKGAVERFFRGSTRRSYSVSPVSAEFEYHTLLPHLTRRRGGGYLGEDTPVSRATLRNCLTRMRAEEWYDPDALFASAEFRSEPLSPFVFGEYSGRDLVLKGQEIRLADRKYVSDSWANSFTPLGVLHRELISVPLFRAYFYLLSSLGLIETAEGDPPKRLMRSRKELPLSPFDGLAAVKVTPLGAWCFGHSAERPTRVAKRAIVLTDAELPILTIQGEALEKRLFLDRIGVRIGAERYRVTEASFIAGCQSITQIEERIKQFHALVTNDPPALWKELFASVRGRSKIFEKGEPALIFTLPDDERIRSLFLRNPLLRSIAIKAEGGRIVCRVGDLKRLGKALAAEGFHFPKLPG